MTNGNDTRERILEAAQELFQIYGYSAVGLSAIVQKSGAPKGSLYYYFPGGKEELALESVRLAGKRIEEDIRVSMAAPGSLPEVFAGHLLDLARRLKEGGKHFSITLLALEARHVNEEIRAACCAVFNTMIALYEQRLIEGGYPLREAHGMAVTVQCIVDSAMSLSVLNDDVGYLEEAAEQVRRLVV